MKNRPIYQMALFTVLASCAAMASGITPSSELDPTSDPAIQPAAPLTGYKLAWSDEFAGNAVDETKWEYRLDSKHWSTQLARNVSVANGVCHLNLRKEKAGDKEYTGAGIITKKYFRYGFYEARVKVPSSAGWHTSFWMMDNHHENSDTSQIELDPLENDSIDLHKFSTDYHQWRSDIGHMKRYQLVKTPPESPLDEWRVYGMEWTPEAAYFYLDGKLVRTAKDLTQQLSKEEKAAGKKPLVRKASDIEKNDMQIWFTSIATWLGKTEKVDDSALPATAQCDYVRFFELAAPNAKASSASAAPASAPPKRTLEKGDVTKEMFMTTQKAQYEKKGWTWNQEKMNDMFAAIDTNGDGIASGEEKKAYWANR